MKLFTLIFLFLLSSIASADLSGTALFVDGDTITISGNKISLHGIDTLEKDVQSIKNILKNYADSIIFE